MDSIETNFGCSYKKTHDSLSSINEAVILVTVTIVFITECIASIIYTSCPNSNSSYNTTQKAVVVVSMIAIVIIIICYRNSIFLAIVVFDFDIHVIIIFGSGCNSSYSTVLEAVVIVSMIAIIVIIRCSNSSSYVNVVNVFTVESHYHHSSLFPLELITSLR